MSLEERIRRAAENILENSSLGGDLMDDEAQVLLEWGLDWAERLVLSTQALDDSQAAPIIERGLLPVRRTMRRIGKLVGNLAQLDQHAAQKRLEKVLEAAAQLPGARVQPPADLQSELGVLRELPPGQALERVLSWFSQEGEEQHGG